MARIRDHMAARGPDASGEWFSNDGRVGLAHRRLAIIDLSDAGIQPMRRGHLLISFNGEIYNFRELRAELESAGHSFVSDSDTEVILAGYAHWGKAVFARLRGMFALGLWDERERRLTLARDPYGIKPLYYANGSGTVRFASSVKALLQSPHISREVDPAGEAGFYLLGSVPDPFTWFRDIRALPSGHTLEITERGTGEPRPYCLIASILADAEEQSADLHHLSAPETAERIGAALHDSVRHHLVADVPVGVFLSAGIDSGALLGLASDCSEAPLMGLTLQFEEYAGREDDETPLAALCAAHYGARHAIGTVGQSDFDRDAPALQAAMDQPSIDGPNVWFISCMARANGFKAALSGLGGDELFGAYPAFTDVPRWNRRLRPVKAVPGLASGSAALAVALGADRVLPRKGLALLRYGGDVPGSWFVRRGLYMPWELAGLMGRDRAKAGLDALDLMPRIAAKLDPRARLDVTRIATLEATLYMRNQLLRDADWASMAHSLEIRTPLVDVELTRDIAPLVIAGRAKNKKACLAAAPNRPLPEAIRYRSKTGFSIPVGQWTGIDSGPVPDNPYAYIRSWARRMGTSYTAGE